MAESVLITGDEGFVGTELRKLLPNAIGLDIKSGNDILKCKLPPASVVYHLAAEPGVVASVKDPLSNARTNILGTIRLAQHYKDARFIFASSGGTIQDSIESPYGLSKKTCEDYIKMLHPNHVILRLPNVYGKGSRSVVDKWLKEKQLTIYGDGDTYRIYAHVDDVARALYYAKDWPPNETYKLGTDQRYSVLEVARAMHKPVIFQDARPGEITHPHSELLNTTPNWSPKIELMEYIDGLLHNSK